MTHSFFAPMEADRVKVLIEDDEIELLMPVANMSVTLQALIQDLGADALDAIPLPNLTSKVAAKVFEFCEKYITNPPLFNCGDDKSANIESWVTEFLDVDQAMLFELVMAANYLDIKPLLDAACKKISDMIKGKTPEEIRKAFNIKNDFTPEEETRVRLENEWCEER
jgi:S-phase kinase-associated protein 1